MTIYGKKYYDGVRIVSGVKFAAFTAICVAAVFLGFNTVLGQFNLMVYPAHITAFSLNTDEQGICEIEFLGEKVRLSIPDFTPLSNWGIQSSQTLSENVYRVMGSCGRIFKQLWDAGIKDLPQEYIQFLNNFEAGVLLPLKERLQGVSNYGR